MNKHVYGYTAVVFINKFKKTIIGKIAINEKATSPTHLCEIIKAIIEKQDGYIIDKIAILSYSYYGYVDLLEGQSNKTESVKQEAAVIQERIDALDKKDIINLCKDLLAGVQSLSINPPHIVQPFMSIVKKHAAIINKLDLL